MGDICVPPTTDVHQVMKEIGSVDIQRLRLTQTIWAAKIATVLLVYGNDGHDVISDHTDSRQLEHALEGATSLAEELCDCIHKAQTDHARQRPR